jgi:metal-dependent amidase/aminoacylase/carboxypeptidase family protein
MIHTAGPAKPNNSGDTVTTTADTPPTHSVLEGLDSIIKPLENLYRDLHTHPELSDQEHRTAAKAAEQLASAGCEVSTGIGGTGVVGVLRNGDGPTVMLRADMDALPVREDTALPYASTATGTDPDGHTVPVMHACGHDMHVTWLAGATKLLARGAGCLARNAHLAVPTRRGAGDRSAGHDRRPPVRPLPQA